MPITVKRLQSVAWKEVYSYDYNDKGAGFKVYSSSLEGITITHDRKIGSGRTIIYYTVAKRRTESPDQAVRWWNEEEKRKRGSGQPPAGSPKSARRSRAAAGD